MLALIGKFLIFLLAIALLIGVIAGQLIKDVYAMRAERKTDALNGSLERREVA